MSGMTSWYDFNPETHEVTELGDIMNVYNAGKVPDRRHWKIKDEDIQNGDKKYWVSTVFLGLDHQYGEGPPLVFETMVFGYHDEASAEAYNENEYSWVRVKPGDLNWSDLDCERYSTYDEAMKGHETMIDKWGERIND